MDKKFYGLILPNKSKKCQPKLKSIFDSDEDESVKPSASKETKLDSKYSSAKLAAKNKLIQKKLAEDDPTIYEYDSVYDALKQNKTEKEISAKKGGSRYISSLLKAADKRKKEQERRQEKKIQDDRDKEGNEFKDKEAFVTSAYKQKMLEMQAEEEREKLLDRVDEMMDVTKQKDLSGFYRHYLNQTIGEEAVPEFGERDEKIKEFTEQIKEKELAKQIKEKELAKQIKEKELTEKVKEKELTEQVKESCSVKTASKEDEKGRDSLMNENLDADSYGSSSSEDDDVKDDQKPLGRNLKSKSRSLHSSSSDNEEEDQKGRIAKKPLHSAHKRKSDHGDSLEGSKRFKNKAKSHKYVHSKSGDDEEEDTKASSSDEDDEQSCVQPKKSTLGKGGQLTCSKSDEGSQSDPENKSANSNALTIPKESHNDDSDLSDEGKNGVNELNDTIEKDVKTTNKRDISVKFAKRTIGDIFDQAQARYFKRMASRN